MWAKDVVANAAGLGRTMVRIERLALRRLQRSVSSRKQVLLVAAGSAPALVLNLQIGGDRFADIGGLSADRYWIIGLTTVVASVVAPATPATRYPQAEDLFQAFGREGRADSIE